MNNGARLFSALFGLLLLVLGFVALGQDHLSVAWRVIGGGVLMLLGGNALYAAYRGKASWLSRIGPLP